MNSTSNYVLFYSIESFNFEAFAYFLEHGCSFKDSSFSVLFVSSYIGHTLLVEHIAETNRSLILEPTNYMSMKEFTPLHAACLNGHFPVIKILMHKGVSIEAKTQNGETPLHIAFERGVL